MIKSSDIHEEVFTYIKTKIAEGNYLRQQDARRFFTEPCKLREYDVVLHLLKEHEVIRHLPNDNLLRGKEFNKFRSFDNLLNRETVFDKILNLVKNNRLVSVLIIVAIVVGGFATFLRDTDYIYDRAKREPQKELPDSSNLKIKKDSVREDKKQVKPVIKARRYSVVKILNVGESYSDPETKAIIGFIGLIDTTRVAIKVNLENEYFNPTSFSDIKPDSVTSGWSSKIQMNGKQYTVLLKKVDSENKKIHIQIREN